MRAFDYGAPAELFARPALTFRGKKKTMSYRRFPSAAEAIRHAIEAIPAPMLSGTILQVGEERYDAMTIRTLYGDPAYPLLRAELGSESD